MVSPVHMVRQDDSLATVQQKMDQHGISGLPVLDAAGQLCGVITRSDLLEAANAARVEGTLDLRLPRGPALDFATREVEVVGQDTLLSECADRMVNQRIHRLYVVTDSRVIGVVGTLEMMLSIAESQLRLPLSEVMTPALTYVRTGAPISLAVDRLKSAQESALIVMEEDWPVGIFSQTEALSCGSAPGNDPVEDWMDLRVVCLPHVLSISRAAAQAVTLGVRRVVVMKDGRPVGNVSGLDFARVVQQAGA
jgi:CBS domain-containing protein